MTNVINTIVKATSTSLVVSVKTQEGVDAHVFKIENKASKGVLGQFDKLIKLIEGQLVDNEVVLIDATPLKGVFKALREKSRDGKIFRLWAKGKGLTFKLVNEGMFTLEDKNRQVTVWKDGYSPATETTEVAEKATTQPPKEVEMKEEVNPAKKIGHLTDATAKALAVDFKWLNIQPGKSFTAGEWSIYTGLAEISGKLNKAKGLKLNKVRVLKREAIEVEKKELTSLFPKGVEGEVALLLCGKDASIALENTTINNRDIFMGDVDSFKLSKMSLPNTTHIVLFWNEEVVALKAPLDFTKVVSEPEELTKTDWVSDWKNTVRTLTVKGVTPKGKKVTTQVYQEGEQYCSSTGVLGTSLEEVTGLTRILRVSEGDVTLINNEEKEVVLKDICTEEELVITLRLTKDGKFIGANDHRVYENIRTCILANYGRSWVILEDFGKHTQETIEPSSEKVTLISLSTGEMFTHSYKIDEKGWYETSTGKSFRTVYDATKVEFGKSVEVVVEDDVPAETTQETMDLETTYKEMVEFQILDCDVITLTKDMFAFDSKMQRIFNASGVDSVKINIANEIDEISNWVSENDSESEDEIYLSYAHSILTGHLIGYRLCVAMSICKGILTQEEVMDLLSN